MKKIISLLLISILSISITNAGDINNDIEIDNLIKLSKGEKIINNMSCKYVEIGNSYNVKNARFLEVNENGELIYKGGEIDKSTKPWKYKGNGKYVSYNLDTKTVTKLDGYKEKEEKVRKVQNKPKVSQIDRFGERNYFPDYKGGYLDFNKYLDFTNEVYDGKSSFIKFSAPSRMSSIDYINKDGFYIYNAMFPRYTTDGNFGFIYEPYQEDRLYIIYGCKEVISTKLQSKLNKVLIKFFSKWNEYRFFDKDNTEDYEKKAELRKAKFDNLIKKIDSIILKSHSEKKKFMLQYIKESALFYRDNKDVNGLGSTRTINDIGVSDFIN